MTVEVLSMRFPGPWLGVIFLSRAVLLSDNFPENGQITGTHVHFYRGSAVGKCGIPPRFTYSNTVCGNARAALSNVMVASHNRAFFAKIRQSAKVCLSRFKQSQRVLHHVIHVKRIVARMRGEPARDGLDLRFVIARGEAQ